MWEIKIKGFREAATMAVEIIKTAYQATGAVVRVSFRGKLKLLIYRTAPKPGEWRRYIVQWVR
jgi:hypothetical protein